MSQVENVVELQVEDQQARNCLECPLLPDIERKQQEGHCPVLVALRERSIRPTTEEAMLFMLSQPPEEAISLVSLKQQLAAKTSSRISNEVAYTRMRTAKKIADEEFGEAVFELSGGTRDKTQIFHAAALKAWCQQAALPQPVEEASPKPKAMRLPVSFHGKTGLPGMQAIFYNYIMKASDDLDEAENQGFAVAEIAMQAEVDPVLVHISIAKALKEVLTGSNLEQYRVSGPMQDRFAFAAQLAERASRSVKREQ